MPSTLCFGDFTIIDESGYDLVGSMLNYYGLPVGNKRKIFGPEHLISDAKISQKLKGCEHKFDVDDVVRNCEDSQMIMRGNKYNRIVMAKAWRLKTNPSYVEDFYEIQDPMERVEQLLLHEEEIIKDVTIVEFERRRNVGSSRQAKNVAPLDHLSP